MILTKKHRSFRNAKGDWSDPLVDYGKSTTYHFDDNAKESDTEKFMIDQIKADKTITFKEADLSPETKEELDKAKIPYEATVIGEIKKR